MPTSSRMAVAIWCAQRNKQGNGGTGQTDNPAAIEQVQCKIALPARDDVGIVPYGKFAICPIAVAAQEGGRATVQ